MTRETTTPGIGRRAAIGAIAAAGAGFALFGPRGPKEAAGGRIVLDYWEKWTGHEGRAMQRIVDEFNNSQSRIFVRYLVTSGLDQKTLIAVAGGDPPDVVGLWNYNVPLYAETEAIIPLDEFDSSYGVSLDRYAPAVRQLLTHPDRSGRSRLWATVNTCGTVAMYYNRGVFRDAGLDPDRPPRTIEELDEYAKKIERTRAGGDIERVGFLHAEPGWWSWIWGYHFGGTLYDAESGRARADSPENTAAFEWLQEYPRRLGPDALKKFRSGFGTAYSSPQNALLTGQVAMVPQGPWLANVIQTFKPDLDYGVAPFPTSAAAYREDEPVGLIDSDILVIPRGVKHPEASMEFIAYTQRPEVVEYLSTAHFKNSPLAESSREFIEKHPNRGVRVHNAIAASPRGFVCPRTRVWPQLKDEFDASMQRMWGLTTPAKQELAAIQARAQGFLDQAEEQRRRRGYEREKAETNGK